LTTLLRRVAAARLATGISLTSASA